jgi:hypothetical protein
MYFVYILAKLAFEIKGAAEHRIFIMKTEEEKISWIQELKQVMEMSVSNSRGNKYYIKYE